MEIIIPLLVIVYLFIVMNEKSSSNRKKHTVTKKKYNDNNKVTLSQNLVEKKEVEKIPEKKVEILDEINYVVEKIHKDYFFEYGVTSLWHMTHRNNLIKIKEYGILSHSKAHQLGLIDVDISDPEVQRRRGRSDNPLQLKIHDFAPLYINQKNPMLYVRRHLQNEICFIEISTNCIDNGKYLITDGNAASRDTAFYGSLSELSQLPWDVLRADYWSSFPDGKRMRCAEVLIYPTVDSKYIKKIHCFSHDTSKYLSNKGIQSSISKHLYFQDI